MAETFRRLSMTGALVLFPAGSVSQLSTAIFLSLFGLVAYAYFRPYICWEESGVASMAQFQIFVVVFLVDIVKYFMFTDKHVFLRKLTMTAPAVAARFCCVQGVPYPGDAKKSEIQVWPFAEIGLPKHTVPIIKA